MSVTATPQDDMPAELFDPDTCKCEFTPYPEGDSDYGKDSWHYLRRCWKCGNTWWALHCRCEQPRRVCGACKT